MSMQEAERVERNRRVSNKETFRHFGQTEGACAHHETDTTMVL